MSTMKLNRVGLAVPPLEPGRKTGVEAGLTTMRLGKEVFMFRPYLSGCNLQAT